MCLCTEIGDSGIVILRKTGGRKEEKKERESNSLPNNELSEERNWWIGNSRVRH